jgi:hypothetical protein
LPADWGLGVGAGGVQGPADTPCRPKAGAGKSPNLAPPGAPNLKPAPCPCSEEERRERLTTNDALSYLREVKTRFANNRKVYDRCADDAGGSRGGGTLPPPLKGNRACCLPSRPLSGTSSRISPWEGPCRRCQPVGHPRTRPALLASLTHPPAPPPSPPCSFLEIMKQFKAQS